MCLQWYISLSKTDVVMSQAHAYDGRQNVQNEEEVKADVLLVY
jgi:hypothetical protein